MTTLLNLFYQLPFDAVVLLFVMLSFAHIYTRQHFSGSGWFRCLVWTALALWFFATLWITTLSRSPGPVHPPELIPFHSYRELLRTGVTEILRTNFMNAVLFYPAGLLAASLLPKKWTRCRRMLTAGVLFAAFSLGIEYSQFLCALGKPEIDDVLHNTLGTLCGTLPVLFGDSLFDPKP